MDFTYDKISYFYDRTIAHIKCVILIQEFVNKQFGNQFKVNYWHDASKFFADTHFGYYYMTFKYLGEKVSKEEERECAEAWLQHYTNETHHPEYHTLSETIDTMNENEIFEMVCDWLAMSYEFGEKDWTEFWMNKMSKKFEWTEEQRLFISKLLVMAVENKKEIIELLDKNVKFPKWNKI